MKTARSCRPRVEELESIALLSTGVSGPISAIVSARRNASTQHHLTGSARGVWTEQRGIPDTGATQDLAGNGKFKGLGDVQVQGALQLLGNVYTGHAYGTLTLTNYHGSVTLTLTGPSQPGFSGPPQSFTFTIASGTGRYKGWQGSGQIDFQESSAMGFTMTFVSTRTCGSTH
jgi:hypothetical protein